MNLNYELYTLNHPHIVYRHDVENFQTFRFFSIAFLVFVLAVFAATRFIDDSAFKAISIVLFSLGAFVSGGVTISALLLGHAKKPEAAPSLDVPLTDGDAMRLIKICQKYDVEDLLVEVSKEMGPVTYANFEALKERLHLRVRQRQHDEAKIVRQRVGI